MRLRLKFLIPCLRRSARPRAPWSSLGLFLALAAALSSAPAQGAAPLRVEHTPVTEAAPGAAVEMTARVLGQEPVRSVTLHVRAGGSRAYYAIPMSLRGVEYRAQIPASFTSVGTLEYYIEAVDAAGNRATAPSADAASSPYPIAVTGELRGEFLRLPQDGEARGPFALDAALVTRPVPGPLYDLELAASWGPLRASAKVEPGGPGAPDASYLLALDTRVFQVQVGDVEASISPLTAEEYGHRGYFVRFDAGGLEAALSSGYAAAGGEGRQARKFHAARVAIGSPVTKLGASAVGVIDVETAGAAADLEQNYVVAGDIGVRLPGLEAQLEAATSLYFPRVQGSFWDAGEGAELPSDLAHKEYFDELARLLWRLPEAARPYILPPHPSSWEAGNPLVDAAVELRLASPLHWSHFSARAYRSGPDFRTLAARAAADREGYAASLRIGPTSGPIRFQAEFERYFDGVQPLFRLLAGEPPIPWARRNVHEHAGGSLTARLGGPEVTLSLGRSAVNPDRSLLELGEGAPKNETFSHGVELREVRFRLGRYAANLRAGISRSAFIDAADPSNAKTTTTNLLAAELTRGTLHYEVVHSLKREVDAGGVAYTPSFTLGVGWKRSDVPLGRFTLQSVEIQGRSTYSHTWGDGAEKSTDSYRVRLLVDPSERVQLGAQFLSTAFSDRKKMETTRRFELTFGCLLRF